MILSLFLFAGIHAFAQQPSFSLGNMSSSNQQLIEEAVKDGLFVVRQRYQLQDTTAQTPALFGWQNRNWFGESYSLGIKVKTGYYLSDKAIRPWIYDPKYEQYTANNKLTPVLSAREYRTVEDTVYKALPNNDISVKEISSSYIFQVQDSVSFEQKGFPVDTCDGTKKGWLVWLVTDKPLEEQTDQLPTYLIYRLEMNFEQGKDRYEIREPSSEKHILGGFYFVPAFNEIGQITFCLAGILNHENSKWYVVCLSDSIDTKVIQPNDSEVGLTPIQIEQSNNINPPPRGRRR